MINKDPILSMREGVTEILMRSGSILRFEALPASSNLRLAAVCSIRLLRYWWGRGGIRCAIAVCRTGIHRM